MRCFKDIGNRVPRGIDQDLQMDSGAGKMTEEGASILGFMTGIMLALLLVMAIMLGLTL